MPLPAFKIRVCCFCNRTTSLLFLHFNSRYGAVQAFVQPGVCTYFNYYDDGLPRVMSAFKEDNTLVKHYEFVPDPKFCFLISDGGPSGPVQDPDQFHPPEVTTVPI